VIILMTAGAVSAAGLMELDELRGEIVAITGPDLHVDIPDPGKAQTILALGTDARLGADAGGGARSDTILLVRLDPDNRTITMTSIPRDLQVDIPGYGTDKINAAYSVGGAALTVETVKELLSTPEEPFRIHHVVEINFTGFRELVDFLGCTYVDIDRDYFNDVSGPLGYATIDIDPGYQELCGSDALDYVRYRHGDTDLVRAARQQDFLRQMLRQPSVRSQLTFGNRSALAKLAGRFVRTDKELSQSTKQLLSLLKLGLGVASKPVQQIPFGLGDLEYSDDYGYLLAAPDVVHRTVGRFLHPPEVEEKEPAKKRKHKKSGVAKGLVNLEDAGAQQAQSLGKGVGVRVYYPRLGIEGSEYEGTPRAYTVGDEAAYRMVVELTDKIGSYYGIQGMQWDTPPILTGPHDDITVDGRDLAVYSDGGKVGLVALRTKRAVYYVHNTLDRDLTREQMIGIAASLTDRARG
jgi:polyisoprenyl-teichoic acid--peptidoglycan teichoic acid transferase